MVLSSLWKTFVLLYSLFIIHFYFSRLGSQRGQWHPTPVLLPGKSYGQRSLVGCSPWGCEESDTTERLPFHFSLSCTGEGNGNPLQYSCLENPTDGGAWWAAVHEVAKTRLSDFTLTFHFHALEKEMATHSSVLAQRIPGTRGAWWAAVYGVTQSRTRLKRLSSSSRSIVFLYHLSGCSIRAKLASWNELGNVPSSSVSERDCRELHYIILKYSVELFRET